MCSFLPSGSHSQVGRVRMSPCELNKGSLVEHSGRGAGFPTQATVHAYSYRQCPFSGCSNKSNRKQRLKETDPTWSQVLFFPVTMVVEKIE